MTLCHVISPAQPDFISTFTNLRDEETALMLQTSSEPCSAAAIPAYLTGIFSTAASLTHLQKPQAPISAVIHQPHNNAAEKTPCATCMCKTPPLPPPAAAAAAAAAAMAHLVWVTADASYPGQLQVALLVQLLPSLCQVRQHQLSHLLQQQQQQ